MRKENCPAAQPARGRTSEEAIMQRTKPPFRSDHVGSLLRTAPIKQARAQREKGEIDAAQLKAVEDREIEKIIKKQEEIGLKLVTDGEFRRSWWNFDFFSMLDGVELYELDHGIQFHGVQTKMQSVRVKGKIGFSNHPMLEHFKFLKAHTKVMPKMTIPSPGVMHFRIEPGAVAKEYYASRDAIFDDLAIAYQKAIKAFYDAGCRYLQLDDIAWAYLCSKSGRLEPRDDIKKRIEEATKYVALDQLCLSPQCGFASTEEGNVLAEDEQWAKLRMIVELADEIWG